MNDPITTHTTAHLFSRRAVLGLATAAVAGSVAGCSSEPSGPKFGGTNETLNLPAHIDPPPVPGEIISAVDGVPPGYPSLPNPLRKTTEGVPGSGGRFTTFQVNWGAPPQPQNKNEYWQELNRRLGVEYSPTLVPGDAYETKLATMLSGGKVADMTHLLTDSANAQQAIQDGAFAELSGVLGGDKIKEYPNLAHVSTYQWEASSINNGIYGIPVDVSYVNALHVYRHDWAEKLGYPDPPKNADEFYELMTSFSKRQPASGRKTFGFGGYTGYVPGFINSLFRVPHIWREEGGKLTHAIETDEYEQAIRYTARLWKGQAFHPDALALSGQGAKDRSLFESGLTGWQAGSAIYWYLNGAFRAVARKNEGAEPKLLLPFGHDGGDYAFARNSGFYGIVAISAEAGKDDERLKEILRVMNYLRAPSPVSEEGFFLRFGLEGVQFTYDDNRVPTPISDSPASGDAGGLNYTGLTPESFYFPGQQQYVQDTISYTETVTQNTVADPTVGLFAKSSAKSASVLAELSTDFANGLVSGRRPMSDLQKFREEWKVKGGDQLRREFEEALQKKR